MFKKYGRIVDLDEFMDKKLLIREFKKFIGYMDLSDSYIERRMGDEFAVYVNKRKSGKKIGNSNSDV